MKDFFKKEAIIWNGLHNQMKDFFKLSAPFANIKLLNLFFFWFVGFDGRKDNTLMPKKSNC